MDHKPLVSLFKKSLTSASPRLSMMLLHIIDYQLDVMYQPGTKMHLSDALIIPKLVLSQVLTSQYMMLKFSQKCLSYHWQK